MAAKYVTTKERHLFIENMMSKLENLSVDECVSMRIKLRPHGRHLYGPCPFHNGTANGSFVVTPSKGLYYCFKCQEGGNGIKFISMNDGIDYLQAAFTIALEKGIITYEEYELYAKKQSYSNDYVSKIKNKYNPENRTAHTEQVKAPFGVCHNVYRIIKECCTLSDEHLNHLRNVRKLSEERIADDYFTFPTRSYERNRIIKRIKEEYPEYTDELLMTVPGFYFDKKLGKLTFYSVKGIGMLLHDPYGRVVAIQIRRDTVKKGQQRYIWFSSSFAICEPDKYLGGAGTGAPRDILYPDNTEKSILCITEGRFKSEVLRDAGNVAVSLQGVGSWKNIDLDIKEIRKDRPVKKIFIMFDADMFGKWEVFKQLVSLSDMLFSLFPFVSIKCGCWHAADGKGIDDLYHNGNISTIQYKDIPEISTIYYKVLDNSLEQFGYSSVREIPEEKVSEFRAYLQESEETAILS